jgi:hypothetical protein
LTPRGSPNHEARSRICEGAAILPDKAMEMIEQRFTGGAGDKHAEKRQRHRLEIKRERNNRLTQKDHGGIYALNTYPL